MTTFDQSKPKILQFRNTKVIIVFFFHFNTEYVSVEYRFLFHV